jgi:hypothetical protein
VLACVERGERERVVRRDRRRDHDRVDDSVLEDVLEAPRSVDAG